MGLRRMALDIHTYENGKMGQLLFQIDDKCYADLCPAFEKFQKATGQQIDPYGDLVVDKYLSLLIAIIDRQRQDHPVRSVLEQFAKTGGAIIFVGD